jgi:hypothetical protein
MTVEVRRAGAWQVVYTGSDQRQVAAVVGRLITLDEDKLRKIGDTIYRKWIQLAHDSNDFPEPDSGSWRDVNYRQDYIAGIQQPMVQHGNLNLSLKGEDALRVELGWAPPRTAHMADGIGKYDGEKHDLRPWLFQFGRIHVHQTKGRYRNLRFIGPGMTKQIAKVMPLLEKQWQTYMEYNGKQVSKNMLNRARQRMGAVMTNVYHAAAQRYGGEGEDADDDHDGYEAFHAVGLKRKAPWRTPGEIEELPKMAAHHRTWLYGGGRAAASQALDDHHWFSSRKRTTVLKHIKDNKTVWKVFRTIWEDTNQQEGAFFTRGIRPARLISGPKAPIAQALREAIKAAILENKV